MASVGGPVSQNPGRAVVPRLAELLHQLGDSERVGEPDVGGGLDGQGRASALPQPRASSLAARLFPRHVQVGVGRPTGQDPGGGVGPGRT